MCKCQGTKCKQFETYRTDENQAYECTCLVTNQKVYLSSNEIDDENDMDCPDAYDPKVLEKCKGCLCKHFLEGFEEDECLLECECEITGELAYVDKKFECPHKAFEPK